MRDEIRDALAAADQLRVDATGIRGPTAEKYLVGASRMRQTWLWAQLERLRVIQRGIKRASPERIELLEAEMDGIRARL